MVRIAINGLGRIGRCILRALYNSHHHQHIKVVAINELASTDSICHLLRYDSTHGPFTIPIQLTKEGFQVGDDPIQAFQQDSIHDLPWHALDIDWVFECTGTIKTRAKAQAHIDQGARRVLISNPADSQIDGTLISGITTVKSDQKILSNGSCSTQCLLPVLHLIDQAFGIERGVTTTIHSAMNDQPVSDRYHPDLRRTRAASYSIVPIDTALPSGIARLMPHLTDKFESLHVRVPTLNVSMLDVSICLKTNTNVSSVNELFFTAAQGPFKKILGITQEKHASIDFNQDTRSGIIDGSQTRVCDDRLLKLMIWFDNEWAFAHRMLDAIY